MKKPEFNVGDVCKVVEQDYHFVKRNKRVRIVACDYDMLDNPRYRVKRVDADAFDERCILATQVIKECDLYKA